MDPGVTTVTAISTADTLLGFTADYEVEIVTSIAESAGAADPALEDEEDFVDIEGVISIEQAAEAIEEIVQASNKPVVFDEKLIPTGDVVKVAADATPE